MQIDETTETQPPTETTSRQSDHPCGRIGRAIFGSLLLAALSPIAPLAPKRFARGVAQHAVLVPAWQLAALIGYAAYKITGEYGYEHGAPVLFYVSTAAPYLVVLGLLWLLTSYMVRPLGSAWDETPRWSFCKSGLVLLAFVLPLPYVLIEVSDLLGRYVFQPPGEDHDWTAWYRIHTITSAVNLGLFCGAMVQIVRGIASIGGQLVPDLPPICRECGYSLEGVADLYRSRPGEVDPAGPVVCSECGAELSASLERTDRLGTAWTRGEYVSPWSWGRTLGQVVRQPSRFYSQLPLHSSRRAALWFWVGSLLLTGVLVAGVFAADCWICMGTGLTSPLLPKMPDPSAVPAVAASQPGAPATAPVAQPPSMGVWLLDCANQVTGITLTIAGLSMLILSLSANRIGRVMSKHRGLNLHPTGLLMMGYLSPAALGAGVLVLVAFVAARLSGEAYLPVAPAWIRGYVGDAEVLASLAGLASLIPILFWYHVITKRATKGIQYANQ